MQIVSIAAVAFLVNVSLSTKPTRNSRCDDRHFFWNGCIAEDNTFERAMHYDPDSGRLGAPGYTEWVTTPFNSTSLGFKKFTLKPHEDATVEIVTYGPSTPLPTNILHYGESVMIPGVNPEAGAGEPPNHSYHDMISWLDNGGVGFLLVLKNNSTLTVEVGHLPEPVSYTAPPDGFARYIAVAFRVAVNATVSVTRHNAVKIEVVYDGPMLPSRNENGHFAYPDIAKPVILNEVDYSSRKLWNTCSTPEGTYGLKAAAALMPTDDPKLCFGYEFIGSLSKDMTTPKPTTEPTGPTPSPTYHSGTSRTSASIILSLVLAAAAAALFS